MGSVAKAKVAFITGGNGITGSAITEYLAANTAKEEWSEIIVTSRSPFKTLVNDPRIKFVPLDFTKDANTLVTEMADICRPVTHAYFSSYVHRDDFEELNSANQALFENFLSAIVRVAPELQSVALQTGGKYYNVSCLLQASTYRPNITCQQEQLSPVTDGCEPGPCSTCALSGNGRCTEAR